MVFFVLFSIQMGWFSSPRKAGSEATGPAQGPGPVEPKETAGQTNVEQLLQQLSAAQSKVTVLAVDVEALRLQRSEAVTEASRLSNILARVNQESDAVRKQAAAALEEAKAEILARSRRIEVLEGEIGALTQQLRDLAERLGRQDARIAEAERKAVATESERVALKASLEALQAERRVLEDRFRSKESLLAEVRKQRDSESAARDSLFRRNWLAKSMASEAAKPAKVPPRKATLNKPSAPKMRVDVSEVASPRGKGAGKAVRTNAPASSVPSGKSR